MGIGHRAWGMGHWLLVISYFEVMKITNNEQITTN